MNSEKVPAKDTSLSSWRQELEFCLKNLNRDSRNFNPDCLRNALCSLTDDLNSDSKSKEELLTKVCNELSVQSDCLSIDEYRPHCVCTLFDGGVLDVYADAIVNAANSALRGGGGVDGAIHMAAGAQLHEACMKIHGCRTGDAVVTPSFNIKSTNHIIHTVGPVYQHCKDDPVLLSSCYRRSLDEALKLNCTSVAFCSISTGVYGYPLLEACTVARDSLRAWMNDHKNTVMNIYLCCFSEKELEAYRLVLN